MIISKDDYHYIARPKKQLCVILLSWSGCAAAIKWQYQKNPEVLFKNFVLKPYSAIFVVTPFIAIGWFLKRQSTVYHECYERTVGHLTDLELLKLETDINPSRKLIYDNLIVPEKENPIK